MTEHTAENGATPRRRCWWCAVTLRWWQLNACRRCKRALVAPSAGPPCPSRSRWDAEPDALRTRVTSPGEGRTPEAGDPS